MRHVGIAAITIALLGLFTVGASAQLENTKIAFLSDRDGNFDVYVMDVDGSNPVNLTRNGALNWGPSWSPDGSKIAFASTRDGNYEIYVMDADGSNPVNLTRHTADDFDPSWSPDGSKIAFHSNRGNGEMHVYVMDADGSNPTRLTQIRANEWEPSWSPNGLRIAFSSDRDKLSRQIYVTDLDGFNSVNLTRDRWDDRVPSWSPDGSKIAFESKQGDWDIYVMDADGSNLTRLTLREGWNENPSWSPDGSKIAFESNRDGNVMQIYVMNADGSNPTKLTRDGRNIQPSWSPSLVALRPPPEPSIVTPSPDEVLPAGTTSATLTIDTDYEGPWSWRLDGPFPNNGLPGGVRVDGTNTTTVTGLAVGEHTIFVALIDPWGFMFDPPVTASVTFRVDGPPLLSITEPASLDLIDWGTVQKGESSSRSITVENVGGGTLSITNITSDNPHFRASPAQFDLAGGESRVVDVVFSPTAVGWESGTLTIAHNAANGPTFSLGVTGIGVVVPRRGDLSNTKIAFDSRRNGIWDVYVINPDGSDLVNLTHSPSADYQPSWSPDGSKIAFVSDRDRTSEIHVMNADGSDPVNLAQNGLYPSWSPDGSKIAFVSTSDGDWEIYVMNADGSSPTQLTNNRESDLFPSWSPDSSKIAFSSSRDGNLEIYVMNADGSNPVRLTDSNWQELSPSWSPDGSKIAFVFAPPRDEKLSEWTRTAPIGSGSQAMNYAIGNLPGHRMVPRSCLPPRVLAPQRFMP